MTDIVQRFPEQERPARLNGGSGRLMESFVMAESDNTEELNGLEARYARIAPLYDLVDLPFEWLRYRPLRRLLCSGLAGEVLEAGVGTGRNLAYYPPGVQVTGIDLSPPMLARARRRRLPDGVNVRLQRGDITAIGFDDDSFDAVVSSFTLCVLPVDVRQTALNELVRVCRPGGRIRLMEYQRSRKPLRRALMRLWEPWVRWAFGADFDLDLDSMIAGAGLTVVESRHVVSDVVRYVALRPD